MSKKDLIVRTLRRNALRKGLLGGSPLWRAVWGVQLALKGWNKISKGGEAPIEFDESLDEGGVWALVHEPEQSRKGRGEGRKAIIGPKRTAPRANVMTGTALATIGKKILEAPSADRINEILGADAVTAPPLSRSQKRAAKKAEKLAVKTAKSDAKVTAKTAKSDAKIAVRNARSDAKVAAKAADQTEKANAKAAALEVKADAKARAAETKQAAKADKRALKAAAKAAKAASAPVVLEVPEGVDSNALSALGEATE